MALRIANFEFFIFQKNLNFYSIGEPHNITLKMDYPSINTGVYRVLSKKINLKNSQTNSCCFDRGEIIKIEQILKLKVNFNRLGSFYVKVIKTTIFSGWVVNCDKIQFFLKINIKETGNITINLIGKFIRKSCNLEQTNSFHKSFLVTVLVTFYFIPNRENVNFCYVSHNHTF